MNGKFKKILLAAVIALFSVIASLSLMACDGNKEDAATYTVTVKTDETTPASGVKVQVRKGGATFDSKTTDTDGKASFELVPDSYDVRLSSLPEYYEVPEDAELSFTASKHDLTIVLAKSFTYSVKLVKPDDSPYYAEGVAVGVCTLDGNCLEAVDVKTDGTVIIEATAGDYHVKVYNLPANAFIEVDGDGYYTGKNFSATDTEMTITVYEGVPVDLTAAPLTTQEKKTFAATNKLYKTDLQRYDAYKVTQEVAAGSEVYFALTPTISGQYNIFTDNKMAYTSNTNSGYFVSFQVLSAGTTYLYTAKNNGNVKATAEFLVTTPFSSYVEQSGVGGDLSLSVGKNDTYAVVAFSPASGGTYTLNVTGGTKAYVAAATGKAPKEFIEDNTEITAPEADDYGINKKISETVSDRKASRGAVVYFAVAVKADSYPAVAEVEIRKTAASKDTSEFATVTEKLTAFSKPVDQEPVGVPMDGTATIVYNETDKFYHLNDETGPVIVVNITKPLDSKRFSEGCSLAYMELGAIDGSLKMYEVADTEPNAQGGERILNYTLFLRGFNEYEYEGRNLKIPDSIETEVYYAKYVNADGMYPLTTELKKYLDLICIEYHDILLDGNFSLLPGGTEPKNAWLFPCYYYQDIIA